MWRADGRGFRDPNFKNARGTVTAVRVPGAATARAYRRRAHGSGVVTGEIARASVVVMTGEFPRLAMLAGSRTRRLARAAPVQTQSYIPS